MALSSKDQSNTSEQLMASIHRFFRWLTTARVVLSLIMLAVMIVMVVIPLYQLVATTLTWGPTDIPRFPGSVEGKFTIFHYVRMLTGRLSQIYTYAPLQHSLTVSIGATLLALLIGGSLAWLVVRTDMPGRKIINQLAVIPYIMPSWTLAQAWVVLFKNRLSGGTPGFFEFVVGQAPPDWLSYGPVPIIICSALALLHFLFPVRLCRSDVHRFKPGRSRRFNGRKSLADLEEDHLSTGLTGGPFRRDHDLLQGLGYFWRAKYSRYSG